MLSARSEAPAAVAKAALPCADNIAHAVVAVGRAPLEHITLMVEMQAVSAAMITMASAPYPTVTAAPHAIDLISSFFSSLCFPPPAPGSERDAVCADAGSTAFVSVALSALKGACAGGADCSVAMSAVGFIPLECSCTFNGAGGAEMWC